MRIHHCCFAVLLNMAAAAGLSAQGEIIIHNPKGDALTGSWTLVTSSPDRYKDEYRFSSTTGGKEPTATATFRPDIKAAGLYHVEVWYSKGGNRAKNTPYLVSYDGGQEVVPVNQQANGGQWFWITTKPFAAGTSGFVRVQNNTGTTGSVVVADAVRWTPAKPGETRPAPSAARNGASVSPSDAGKKNHTLNVTADRGAKIIRTPDQPGYAEGSTVTVTVKADEGYVFNGWEGDASGFKNPLKLQMTGNKTLKAKIAEAGIGVIMDDPSPEVKFDGTAGWSRNTQPWPGARYETYRYSSVTQSDKATATAKYAPDIPKAGKYDVYIWYPHGNNRSSKARWSLVYKGGNKSFIIDQKKTGGQWVLLAQDIPFDAGVKDQQFLLLENNTGEPGGKGTVVVADAAAFVYMGP